MAFARLSDIYGRKTMVLIAWIIFTGFSLGCALAKTMEQLYVSRTPGSFTCSRLAVLFSEACKALEDQECTP
jgi:MFS family permease